MRVKAAASHWLRQSEYDCKGRRQGSGLQGRCSGGLDYAQNCHFWVRAGANLQRKGLARVGGSRDTSRFDAAAALRITGARETAQPKLRGAILLGSRDSTCWRCLALHLQEPSCLDTWPSPGSVGILGTCCWLRSPGRCALCGICRARQGSRPPV